MVRIPFSAPTVLKACGVALAVSLGLAAIVGSGPAPAAAQSSGNGLESLDGLQKRLKPGIKGADDRITVDAFTLPWAAVGRVNRSDGAFCTGTLVSPNKVLTAAHCIYNKRTGNWMPPSGLHFAAGYQRGEWLTHSPVTQVVTGPGYTPTRSGKGGKSDHDWAIMTLAKPIGNEVGYFGTAPGLERATRVAQVGYSFDRRHVQTANLGCKVLGRGGPNTYVHDCDTVNGDSGSPIFVWAKDGPRVIGIHVSTAKMNTGTSVGLFVPVSEPLPNEIRAVAADLPVDQDTGAFLVGSNGFDTIEAFRAKIESPETGPLTNYEFGMLVMGSTID
ncbi:MAG: trypsin-like serine peptidase [Rhodospirillaceae bacterium]